MKFERFVTGPIQVNTYLIYDEDSREAILLDVGGSVDEIIAFIKDKSLNLMGIYNTHGHFDHILGARELQDKTDARFYVHEGDSLFVENLTTQLNLYGMPPAASPKITGYINEQTELFIGKTPVKVIETPGHTPGGVCFLIDDNLFSGDTLFLESVGRTDLPGGDYRTLQQSIRQKLFTLPDNIKVYPGHEDYSDIGHEKQYNFMV